MSALNKQTSHIPHIHTLLFSQGFEATMTFFCTLFVFADD